MKKEPKGQESGFIVPPENVEQLVEENLTHFYGAKRTRVQPGIMWLFGTATYPSFFDHPEFRIKDRRRTMVARPYQLDLSSLEALVKLASEKQLDLSIRAPSNYTYRTFLVILTERSAAKGIGVLQGALSDDDEGEDGDEGEPTP